MKERGGQFLRKLVLSRIGFRISGKMKTNAAHPIGGARSYIYKSSLSKLNLIGLSYWTLSGQGASAARDVISFISDSPMTKNGHHPSRKD